MRTTILTSWRFALLASFGLMTACSSSGKTNQETGGSGGSESSGGSSGTGGSKSVIHRPVATTCDPIEPRSESQIPAGGAGGVESGDYACEFDADCDERPNGYCSTTTNELGEWRTVCGYGCQKDADCAENQICECGTRGGWCVRANCATDADCGGDNLCIKTSFNDGCGTNNQYNCQTAQDTCAKDADCAPDEQCRHDGTRHLCDEGFTCNIGRPFLVLGHERLAEARRSNEWLDRVRPASIELPAERATLLAAKWTQVGLMEHASIAAFARFALQLLALGAPPELLSATSDAMADETRHAQIAFGLATRYGGEPVGPGKLSMDAALEDVDMESILVNVVLEGCCGETVAAYEAAVAAEGTVDPEVRQALAHIAEDERRHAELAWRFVRWALEQNPSLKMSVLRIVEQELADTRSAAPLPLEDAWLSDYGIVPEAHRRTLRLDALEQLVLPCMQSLCATVSPKSPSSHERTDGALALQALA